MKIETKRLKMIVITENDWALFLQLHSNPEVISLCFDKPDIEVVRGKFESRLVPWNVDSSSWLCFVIFDKQSGNSIGITGFTVENNVAEVGYLLLPEFYGNGYGSESLSGLLDWAESVQEINAYKAVVTEGNIGSEKVLLKCGFQLDHIIPDAYEIGGELFADHVYSRDDKVT
jgi:RimJ/RimL family protein N-acetyltransferase